MDITTFYGYKSQFIFYFENNGQNPAQISNIELLQRNQLVNNYIYHEIENTIPFTITGDGKIDIVSDFYSMNVNSYELDITFRVDINLIDVSDLTTVIDTTTLDLSFDLTNGYICDATYYELLNKLNKYYKLGPNSSEDTTIKSYNMTSTGIPIITFDNYREYNIFSLRYRPQFVIFNNSNLGTIVTVGHFYYNYETKSLEAYLTSDEQNTMVGMTFNNIFMFYTDTVLNNISFTY